MPSSRPDPSAGRERAKAGRIVQHGLTLDLSARYRYNVKRPRICKPLAFFIAGSTGFALYYLTALTLQHGLQLQAGVAALLGALIAIVPTFLLQRFWVFADRGSVWRAFAQYCGLQIVNAVVISLLASLGQWLGVPPAINFVISGAAATVLSWFGLSRIVFVQGR